MDSSDQSGTATRPSSPVGFVTSSPEALIEWPTGTFPQLQRPPAVSLVVLLAIVPRRDLPVSPLSCKGAAKQFRANNKKIKPNIIEFFNDSPLPILFPWLIKPQDAAPDEQHSYFTYVIRAVGGYRDRLAQYLYDKGVYTTLRYHPLHMNSIYKSDAHLPVTEQLNEEALSVPIHPRLSDDELAYIIDLLKKFAAWEAEMEPKKWKNRKIQTYN